MRWEVACSLGSALVLGAVSAQAQQSLRAYGLEFTVISNAVMAIGEDYPVLKVIQVGGPECGEEGGTNDLEDFEFGVSVHLGEAQSGVYVYPDAECRQDFRSMWGNAYGNVNGETNRLISSIKGTREAWGYYKIEVDLTPLGASSYTYQVWSHGVLTLHATNQGAFSAVNTLNVEDYDPRVNPVFLTDAGPAALVEFPDGTHFILNGEASTGASGGAGVGDRMLIIAEGATNQVNYVSRVDVFGSANLPSFAINDARIGMFGRPHKALGSVNFTAANGRLAAGPFQGTTTNGPSSGVLVDFKKGAIHWSAQTEPFALAETNAQFLLSASGLAASDWPYTPYWGPAGLSRSNDMLFLSADFSNLQSTGVVLQVFRSNTLSGLIYGTNGTALATLTDTNPLITGWASTLGTFSISVAEPTQVRGHDGTVAEGDRFVFAPHLSTIEIGRIHSAHVLAHGTAGFTIISESTEDARIPEPKVQIEREPSGLILSWPYYRYMYLVARTNLVEGRVSGDPYSEATYRDFRWYLSVNPTNRMRFYSLQHLHYYYINP